MNTIELQLLDAVADISMLQCSAQIQILFINAHFLADDASHALASSATVKPTFNVEEKVVVIVMDELQRRKKEGGGVLMDFITIGLSPLEFSTQHFDGFILCH